MIKWLPYTQAAALGAVLTMALSGTASAQVTAPPGSTLRTCTAAELRAEQRYWPLQNKNLLDFGVSGADYRFNYSFGAVSATHEGNAAAISAKGELLFWYDGEARLQRPSGNPVDPAGGVFPTSPSLPVTTVSGNMSNYSTSNAPGSFIVGQPNNPNQYIVITNDTQIGGVGALGRTNGLYYRVVDATTNAIVGPADTAFPGTPTGTSASESLAVTPNATGDGYWVVTTKRGDNGIYVWPINKANGGVGPVTYYANVMQNTSVTPATPINDLGVYSNLMFSPDGTKLSFVNRQYDPAATQGGVPNIVVMNFNPATGVPTTGIGFTVAKHLYGAYNTDPALNGWFLTYLSLYYPAFSQTGRYLYVSSVATGVARYLLRYDLAAGTVTQVQASENITYWGGAVRGTGSMNDDGGQVMLGADGAIWWTHMGGPQQFGLANQNPAGNASRDGAYNSASPNFLTRIITPDDAYGRTPSVTDIPINGSTGSFTNQGLTKTVGACWGLPDLTLTKGVTSPAPPANVLAGTSITYEVKVSNAATAAEALYLRLGDLLPAELDATTASWSCTGSDAATSPCPTLAATGSQLSTSNFNLAPGRSLTFTIQATVKSSVVGGTTVTNTGRLDGIPIDAKCNGQAVTFNQTSTVPFAQEGYCTATKDVVIGAPVAPDYPVVKLVKQASASAVPANTPVTFTVTMSNEGKVAASNLSLVDAAPAGATFDGNWTCTATGTATCPTTPNPITGNLNLSGLSLPPNSSLQFSVSASITQGVTNVATLSGVVTGGTCNGETDGDCTASAPVGLGTGTPTSPAPTPVPVDDPWALLALGALAAATGARHLRARQATRR